MFLEWNFIEDGEDFSVVYFAKHLREILASSKEWHMDGTFKTVLRQPRLQQLFTIMAIYNDQAIPIVFCLMTARTATLYEKIFCHLMENIPNLQQPRNIVSDYEAAIKAAVWRAFPLARQVGCWFHFAQMITTILVMEFSILQKYLTLPYQLRNGQI
ncbi:hypothetical protein LSTR_LSTR011013 [Laodelphax striatellus]|uniref:MULE transposase domain-containing protein n=1 Tax=Laodelphax striatellus TaxID=195883 RepID=A0A482WYX5_LAOST|nr:hypothetical protein LSTR_LSTR011013 [Laodelphax striatellus]